ncbi:bifunctional N(6)-L-threonylcarbamoyladenine synthase/serine/threonine protein kinase [Halorubrum sp. GN11_10-6_MGM]|uniref:bifunctional N(6)-L-threonylcarbamoyladenine synthase/serine/threonine protein kinase n=1 Tax=Halorubrum sp. GN11_10-6_MGM TaxID=2518112 RepID=UPI0010F67961|nr:bifunctional N(6)-L-threonylcarbamoyladenine synthase/serine/threonine protein kinase [Halorubrum sp. GN11_10-6_MGM]TKX75324.1 bifunctional N(6)-L-threonylcarbamoyladenine synthase/serine/threonine protein kinase [Halorubrum sp. GN11_10-6_MGM]
MRVLGIEGTAWCASAALYDAETDSVLIESDPYEPDSGGIHPREAAEHMSEAVPTVVDEVLTAAEAEYGPDAIDAVAFSRGPGLGPCLRIVGTAARSLAGTLGVPLVGVNHMVAHLEIGRHRSGFDNPVCLNASGANAHLLGYHDGRYRVLGETMDAGVGNAIDKFTRHVGWSHPGGPKVEAAAAEFAATASGSETGEPEGGAETRPLADAELLDLPYVVKGMDFSFSGISSAANDAADDGVPVEEICFSLQEHVFAMLTEVSERALSLTGADELVLGGGVAQNDRLREMLAAMCEARGADFHASEPRFLRDNAGMIAVLGAKMAAAGDTVAIPESAVDPNFRPDQVPVTWRGGESVARPTEGGTAADGTTGRDPDAARRGAEATVTVVGAEGDRRVVKRRVEKSYRHPELDEALRRDRTVAEARLTSEARRAGVPTPLVYDVDLAAATLTLQHVGECDLAAALDERATEAVGRDLARLHGAGMVHGDPTTRNVRVSGGGVAARSESGESDPGPETYLIDFGLGYHTGHVEDHAMDLHVFEGSIRATATDPDPLIAAFEAGYEAVGDDEVLDRLRDVAGRGRYR